MYIGEGFLIILNSIILENVISSGRFKFDILKNKVKRFLISFLENIFLRGVNRMRGWFGSVDSFEWFNSFVLEKDYLLGDFLLGILLVFLLFLVW